MVGTPPRPRKNEGHERGAQEKALGTVSPQPERGATEAGDDEHSGLPGQRGRPAKRSERPAEPGGPPVRAARWTTRIASAHSSAKTTSGWKRCSSGRRPDRPPRTRPPPSRGPGFAARPPSRSALWSGRALFRNRARSDVRRTTAPTSPARPLRPDRGRSPHERDGARDPHLTARRCKRRRAGRDQDQPEGPSQIVRGKLERERRQRRSRVLAADRHQLEERRRRILVVVGLRRDPVMHIEILRVGQVLARIDLAELADRRDPEPPATKKAASANPTTT